MQNNWQDVIVALAAMLLLVALHGALVACEFSLVKLRYTLTDTAVLAEARKRRRIAKLMDEADQVARGIRFGLKFSAAGLGAALMFLWVLLVGHWPGQTGNAAEPWLAGAAFLGLVAVLYLVGELIPRGLALAHPLAMLRLTSWVALGLAALSYPLRLVLRTLAQGFFRRAGVAVRQDFNMLDIEVQFRAMGEEDRVIPPFLRTILVNTLRLRDLELSDVLLPRNRVVFCDVRDPPEITLELVRRTGHTRYPLCDGDLDHCLGLVHIKEIFRQRSGSAPLDLRDLRRDILRLPATEPLEAALEKFLRQKTHLAIVLDEFGGAAGIVTLEQLIEELVGEIQDETAPAPEPAVRLLADGRTYRVTGLAPLREVAAALRVPLEHEEVSTFGGLVTAELGRIPAPKERVLLPQYGLEVTVEETDGRRILAATVRVTPPGAGEKP